MDVRWPLISAYAVAWEWWTRSSRLIEIIDEINPLALDDGASRVLCMGL